jgi:hypothetical protein
VWGNEIPRDQLGASGDVDDARLLAGLKATADTERHLAGRRAREAAAERSKGDAT